MQKRFFQSRSSFVLLCAVVAIPAAANARTYRQANHVQTVVPAQTRTYSDVPGSESIFDYSRSAPPAQPHMLHQAPYATKKNLPPEMTVEVPVEPKRATPASVTQPAGEAPTTTALQPQIGAPLEAAPDTSASAASVSAVEQAVSETEMNQYLGKIHKFPASEMPLKVYFPQRSTAADQEARSVALSALDEWCAASEGLISYKEVTQPKGASMIVHWRNYNPSTDGGPGGQRVLGNTRNNFWTENGKTTITSSDVRLHLLNGRLYKQVALHELGHGLGLLHTSWPSSVMHVSAPLNMETLPGNDRKLIFALYGKPEAGTVTAGQWMPAQMAPVDAK